MKVHVRPASIDFHIPRPVEVLPRMSTEPCPTYMTLGSESATLTAPIDPPKKPSEILCQDIPLSVVSQTPPPVVPISQRSRSAGKPVTADDLPPRNGPAIRNWRSLKARESMVWEPRGSREASVIRDSRIPMGRKRCMRSLLKREKQSLKEWAVAHKMRSCQAFFEWVKIR